MLRIVVPDLHWRPSHGGGRASERRVVRFGPEQAGVDGDGAAGESPACFVAVRDFGVRALRVMESDKMPTRTTSKTVTFKRPFIVSGFDQVQAAGTYTVDTEEEQLDAISFPAWKRIATVIELKKAGATEYQRIDPDELHEALMRDGQQTDPGEPPSATSAKGQLNRARAARLVRRKKF
jgi:hypothetical protein